MASHFALRCGGSWPPLFSLGFQPKLRAKLSCLTTFLSLVYYEFIMQFYHQGCTGKLVINTYRRNSMMITGSSIYSQARVCMV